MHARIVLGWIALVAVAAFLLLFLGLPLLTSLVAGLDPGLLLEAVRHPVYRAGMLNSAAIAARRSAAMRSPKSNNRSCVAVRPSIRDLISSGRPS